MFKCEITQKVEIQIFLNDKVAVLPFCLEVGFKKGKSQKTTF